MKDFAKSIVVGNASGIKEFNTEADLRRWCIEHQYAYTPTHGGYYRLEDDKPGRNRPDLAAHVKAGNKKVGNGITKFGVGTKVIAEGHKAQVTYESVERGPNGIPFGWVRVVFIEGPWKGNVMEYYDYDLKKA